MSFDISSGNVVIAIGAFNLIPVPTILQGYTPEDIYSYDQLANAETQMGLDGRLSGGFVAQAVMQTFTQMPNGPSVSFWDTIVAAQRANFTLYQLFANITIISLGATYIQRNGIIVDASPAPSAGKVMGHRTFKVAWESVDKAAI